VTQLPPAEAGEFENFVSYGAHEQQAEGLKAISRWLIAATPPDHLASLQEAARGGFKTGGGANAYHRLMAKNLKDSSKDEGFRPRARTIKMVAIAAR